MAAERSDRHRLIALAVFLCAGVSLLATAPAQAPANTPAPVIARLNAEINKALAAPDLRDRLTQAAVVPAGGTPEQFAAAILAEYDSNGRIVRPAGIKAP